MKIVSRTLQQMIEICAELVTRGVRFTAEQKMDGTAYWVIICRGDF